MEKPGKSADTVQGIDYLQNLTFWFESPRWLPNLGFATLIGAIPLLGPLFLLGYQFHIADAVIRRPGSRYPDLELDRFSDYLMGGIAPFLVLTVFSISLMPLALFFYLLTAGVYASAGTQLPLAVIMAWNLVVVAVVSLAGMTLGLLLIPMLLRAGLSGDFQEAFDWQFVGQFLRLTWRETVLGVLFLGAVTPLVLLAGTMLFCVGIFIAATMVSMAWGWLQIQLYLLYLSRGGRPVPLNE